MGLSLGLCQISTVVPYSDFDLRARAPAGEGLPGSRRSKGERDKDTVKNQPKFKVRKRQTKGKTGRSTASVHLHHLTELKSLSPIDWLEKTLKTKSVPFLLNAVTKSEQATLNANLFILTSDVSLQNGKWSQCNLTFTGGWVLVHGKLRNSHIQW